MGSNRSFPVRGPDAQVALIAHVVPIRRSARDLLSKSVGVLTLMPAKTPQSPSVELVQSLFDLTAAEARVARSLTMGQTVDEIASEKECHPTPSAPKSAECWRRQGPGDKPT
jgi:hypothetical protein